MNLRLMVLIFLFATSFVSASQGQKFVAGTEAQRVLSCSLPLDEEFSLVALGQSADQPLYYFVASGFIRGTIKNNTNNKSETEVLLNSKNDRAEVRYLWSSHSRLLFSSSPFILKRDALGWQVTEGPLGPVPQEAVANFVAHIVSRRQYHPVSPSRTVLPKDFTCGIGTSLF